MDWQRVHDLFNALFLNNDQANYLAGKFYDPHNRNLMEGDTVTRKKAGYLKTGQDSKLRTGEGITLAIAADGAW